ncbi:MAG: DUF2130 domain-containing protein [Bacilli bacterium]|nr:DUF2130 domain-containing protein [Bacilli bacterium]
MPEIKCPHCQKVFSVSEEQYRSIASSVRDVEFEKELHRRLELEEVKNRQNLTILEEKHKNELLDKQRNLEKEIDELKTKIKLNESEKELEIQKAISSKDHEIDKLKNDLLNQKNEEVRKLKEKEEEVSYYRDLKTRMSTKLVGETLEQHCQIQFNQIRMSAFPDAYFEKDNDAKSGSKGDFIFREKTKEGAELISIMFEMKNENDETASKHKNEDFFKELDKDRNEKNCEYAVLVSMLEPDNELYNAGIVDVSYRYKKMYVVRPQCFIPIISLLRNAALNAAEAKNELMLVRNENIDITNFEQELNDQQQLVARNYELAKDHFTTAIEEIDKTIDHLQKVRKELVGSEKNLRIANDKVQNLSIKSLTKNNPTMREKFAELKNK